MSDLSRRLCALALILCVGPAVRAGRGQSLQPVFEPANEAALRTWSPEFPPADSSLFSQQRTGVIAARTAQLRAQDPDSPELFEMLVYQERPAEALRVLRRITEIRPGKMARPFDLIRQRYYVFQGGPALFGASPTDYSDQLRGMIAVAKLRLATLSREEAAAVALPMLFVESLASGGRGNAPVRELRALVEEYAGTQAALLAEVDLLLALNEPLEPFARRHPGTVAGAKALFMKAFQLGHNLPGGFDPTDRFIQTLDIVKEIEDGGYPPCEWVEKAQWLGTELYAPRAPYTSENIDRLLNRYREFVRDHFARPDHDAFESGLGVVISRMGELSRLKGEGLAGVERMFADLERIDAGRARLLRALFSIKAMTEAPLERAALLQQAKDLLVSLHPPGSSGLSSPRALATLASLYFADRDYGPARDAYRQYLALYPRTGWSWVAALRVGRSEEALGDLHAASSSYRTAAAQYAGVPAARALGHAYAARASEALSQFDDALIEYQRALDGWDSLDGAVFRLLESRPVQPNNPFSSRDASEVRKASLPDRIAQLQRSAALPGGALLERGRWLLEHARRQEAIVSLEQVVTQYATSAAVPEARFLVHRARLERAVELAHGDLPVPDLGAALREVEALSGEPYDAGVFAAKIARASILWMQGRAEAESVMGGALTEWQRQQSRPLRRLPRSMQRDLVEIRDLLFRPAGDGVFSGSRWNGFAWPSSPARFLIVNPDVSVKLPDEDATHESVAPALAGMDNVLLLTTEQVALLDTILSTLGGSRQGRPATVMSTPNQPIGSSRDILGFWNRFFAARPGHWSGWVFETYPLVTLVSFSNTERTSAVASVTVGFGGAAYVLLKDQGAWRVTEITGEWVQ